MILSDAINDAIRLSMIKDSKVLCYGLGVTDPKNVFGTTANLENEFGGDRVFDIPCSENAITGIAVGAALGGYKSILTHQRLDFALLSIDQIVNSAAKWHYMFGSQNNVPITIRMILGRGWGQGPTHSQNLQSWFAHIPGLKVVSPSNAYDAKGLLLSAIFDPNPVIFLEHRWLHNSISDVPDEYYEVPIGTPNQISFGKDITLVSNSYMIPECLDAAKALKNRYGVTCDIFDLNTIRPLNLDSINASVLKNRKLLCVDAGMSSFSVSSEVMAEIMSRNENLLGIDLAKIGLPNSAEPTSYSLTKNYYNSADDVFEKVLEMLEIKSDLSKKIRNATHHDVPGSWFKGPF